MTLDNDVARQLDQVVRTRGQPFKVVVNDLLRAGLEAAGRPRPSGTRFRTKGFDLGPSLLRSLDKVSEVLARVEGERHR